MKPPRITSTYLILDVMKGRKKLAKYLAASGGAGLPVIIHATLTDEFGKDDGDSIEFNANVTRVEVAA